METIVSKCLTCEHYREIKALKDNNGFMAQSNSGGPSGLYAPSHICGVSNMALIIITDDNGDSVPDIKECTEYSKKEE